MRWDALTRRWAREDDEAERLKTTRLIPSEEWAALFGEAGVEPPSEPLSGADLLRRPGVTYDLISRLSPPERPLDEEEARCVETALRYAGYLEKEARAAQRTAAMDGVPIPQDLDYSAVTGLSAEGRQKLSRWRPQSLGQALRLSGVTPADVQLLSVVLRQRGRRNGG